VGGGTYAYGSYPDIDELFKKQAVQLDQKKRAETLADIQKLVYEKTIVAPIWQLAFINGVGSRVGESGFGLITDFAYTAPYEDITIKGG
jgi:peptide/nickel transport system substrate-binding protein